MKILIAGASGFLGSYITKAFPDAILVSRTKKVGYITYDELPKSVDLIIHAAGESLFGLPTKAKFERMAHSRASVLVKLSQVNAKHIVCFSGIDVLPKGKITSQTKPSLNSPVSIVETELLNINPAISIIRLGIIQAEGSAISKLPFALVPNAQTYYTDVSDIISYLKKGSFEKYHNIVTKKVTYKKLFQKNGVFVLSFPRLFVPTYLKAFVWDREID